MILRLEVPGLEPLLGHRDGKQKVIACVLSPIQARRKPELQTKVKPFCSDPKRVIEGPRAVGAIPCGDLFGLALSNNKPPERNAFAPSGSHKGVNFDLGDYSNIGGSVLFWGASSKRAAMLTGGPNAPSSKMLEPFRVLDLEPFDC